MKFLAHAGSGETLLQATSVLCELLSPWQQPSQQEPWSPGVAKEVPQNLAKNARGKLTLDMLL